MVYVIASTGTADAKLPPLPIGLLVAAALNLMSEAEDLPQPVMVTVSDTQSINLQFDRDPATLQAINRWAFRFGGLLTNEPHCGKDGRPEIWRRLEFSYYGIRACAWTHAKAAPASP